MVVTDQGKADPDCGETLEFDEDQPVWLREAVEEFDEYGLKPYRPPRFSDGIYLHEIIRELEDNYDAEIRFIGRDIREGDPWEIQIDGRIAREVHRHRHQDGYSVVEMESSDFKEWVRTTVDDTEVG